MSFASIASPQFQTLDAMPVPVLVLGGSGYVAGELLRLLAEHPVLEAAAVVSESRAGDPVAAAFPHLAGCYPQLFFSGPAELERLVAFAPRLAVFSALPHGAAAARIEEVLAAAEGAGTEVRVVDLAADFRFASAAAWEAVYGHPHGAPARVGSFTCGLPEQVEGVPAGNVAHPGCFTTAVLLALVPLLRRGLIEPRADVVAVTGSTGAGRTPIPTTHHPERRSDLFAYKPLAHRHQPEMAALAEAASGVAATVRFIPQAGPFARGIYATVLARAARPIAAEEVAAALDEDYAGSAFVDVGAGPPRLQEVVGSNRCRLGVALDGDTVAVFSALDNLIKGAAGGGLQWMNRLLGLPEGAGLLRPGLGWT
jgi:N-acetyl-gamma-glutamyl-phosphate reductase common form